MALSVQNKSFLAVLNKIDVDVKQFPDKTFDGLFDNIPEETNYFLNWFIENITPDNALTQSEQAIYFQLERTQSLPTEEEMNYVLSSCNPTYEELMSLDVNYVNNFLSKDLDDMKKYYEDLSNIYTDVETNYNNIIKKQNKIKEGITARKKQLSSIKQGCHEANLSFDHKIDEVKMFLLKKPHFNFSVDIFKDLLVKEKIISHKFNRIMLLDKRIFSCVKLDSLIYLKKDLECVEISLTLSEGFQKAKKAKNEFLVELHQKKGSQKNFNQLIQFYLLNNDGRDAEISEEINILEFEVFEKLKKASGLYFQKIWDEYLLNKIDLNRAYISKLTECKDYIKSSWKINSFLLHILLKCATNIESLLDIRKQLYLNLIEYEANFSNEVTNLELRKQRFREVSLHQNPFLLELKNIMNLEENPENNEETLKKVVELMLYTCNDSNFITHKFRNDLQTSIKALFNNMLFGPMNQVLFTPIELLIKFQDCEERKNKLSQLVKRIASKYVDAKESISKSDRKKLLLWIDYIINHEASTAKITQSPPS